MTRREKLSSKSAGICKSQAKIRFTTSTAAICRKLKNRFYLCIYHKNKFCVYSIGSVYTHSLKICTHIYISECCMHVYISSDLFPLKTAGSCRRDSLRIAYICFYAYLHINIRISWKCTRICITWKMYVFMYSKQQLAVVKEMAEELLPTIEENKNLRGGAFSGLENMLWIWKTFFEICLICILHGTLHWSECFEHVLDTFILVQLFQDIYILYSMLKNWTRFLIFALTQVFFWRWCGWFFFLYEISCIRRRCRGKCSGSFWQTIPFSKYTLSIDKYIYIYSVWKLIVLDDSVEAMLCFEYIYY